MSVNVYAISTDNFDSTEALEESDLCSYITKYIEDEFNKKKLMKNCANLIQYLRIFRELSAFYDDAAQFAISEKNFIDFVQIHNNSGLIEDDEIIHVNKYSMSEDANSETLINIINNTGFQSFSYLIDTESLNDIEL
ncbi:hypothetical protein [Mammaliicoccus vitulinus]|uniref:hypothetical protein n=1 Tax=Mammaliicoccus vitulinus TaxID=71237 RepID=UPI00248C6F62|nr:hypothetical protein [Mammaliicoccus vitulinus]